MLFKKIFKKKNKMKINEFPTRNPFILAPMQEINDIAFRLLCKRYNCGLTETGMIHPLTKQEFYLEDRPIVQLFCTKTKGIKDFVKKYNKRVAGWDFNLGCPAKTAKKLGHGSYLTDLEVIEDILKTIRLSAGKNKPFIVKVRKSDISFEILKIAEKYCDAIAIHARTREQGYAGKPDLKFAQKIKKKSKIPVIYSGNVNKNNYRKLLRKFDYLMIGREAIGNPEIFSFLSEGKDYVNSNKNSFHEYLKISKKYNFPFRQLKLQAMNFTKGMKNAKELRLRIFKAKDKKQLKDLFNPAK